MKINGVDCTFHHTGIPTTEVRPNERYSPRFGLYTSDAPCRTIRAQWHRFDTASPLHELIRTVPHVAFKVPDLAAVIHNSEIILARYEPLPGFHVAMIADGGIPIEFIQTNLSDEEIWAKAITTSIL